MDIELKTEGGEENAELPVEVVEAVVDNAANEIVNEVGELIWQQQIQNNLMEITSSIQMLSSLLMQIMETLSTLARAEQIELLGQSYPTSQPSDAVESLEAILPIPEPEPEEKKDKPKSKGAEEKETKRRWL